MATLERDGGSVYYEDYGRGDRAILLLHGWGMGVRTWDYTLPALLAAGHRVVAMDHRGCGRSDKDFDDMSIAAIAGDAVALVRHLGLRKVVLNGWSLGGAVAVAAAAGLGSACSGRGLTCAATPAYLQKPGFPHGGTEDVFAQTLAGLAEDRVNFLATLAKGVCSKPVTAEVQNWLWGIFLEASPRAAATLSELGTLDQRQLLASLQVPILGFVGGRDAIMDPGVSRTVTEFNPGARTVEFLDAGHAPFIEETARYNKELLAFLAECL